MVNERLVAAVLDCWLIDCGSVLLDTLFAVVAVLCRCVLEQLWHS